MEYQLKSFIWAMGVIIAVGFLSLRISFSALSPESNGSDTNLISIKKCYKNDCSSSKLVSNIGVINNDGLTSYIEFSPINDSTFNKNKDRIEYYTIELTNTKSQDAFATLYFDINNDSSIIYTVEKSKRENFVKENQYKYYKIALKENNNTPIIKTYDVIDENNNVLMNNILLRANETKTFYLYIWKSRDELLKNNMLNVNGKYFVADLYVKGEYK